ncbi:hypothetical protein Gohar_014759 [Gossypium harknessii]|uniref:adenylate kinase n=1 Tax=Gossypium harknessii TaxID=34285 RepID=A0A7J9FXR7_9ROSI|nr:hypothetical protein [Gossypium harknessii]
MIINKLSHLATVTAAAVTAGPPLYRLLKLTVSRFHGAAQPQPDTDYWFYYHVSPSQQESRRDELFRSTPVADTNGSVPLRGVQWAFIGSPRAKKRVYAVMLSKLLEVPHITMASLVRQELSPYSNLYKQIANAIDHGELVNEDIILGLLSKRLEDGHYTGETGFILDGIPRSRIQAEILDQLADIDLVVNFKCTEDLMMNNQGEASWTERLQDYIKQVCNPHISLHWNYDFGCMFAYIYIYGLIAFEISYHLGLFISLVISMSFKCQFRYNMKHI